MADQGIWFKLHCSALDDPDLDALDVADFGRWAKLGAYVKRHGTGGRLMVLAPARVLCAMFQVAGIDDVKTCLKRLPGVHSEEMHNSTVSNETGLSVSFSNWLKYQGDFSTPRVSKFRQLKRSKRRGEEKRQEETRTPPRVSMAPPVNLSELPDAHRTFLQACPEPFRGQWSDAEWWISLTDAYDRLDLQTEASKYMAHQGSLPERERHRNVRRGLRNWLATADRWRQRDAERRAARGDAR